MWNVFDVVFPSGPPSRTVGSSLRNYVLVYVASDIGQWEVYLECKQAHECDLTECKYGQQGEMHFYGVNYVTRSQIKDVLLWSIDLPRSRTRNSCSNERLLNPQCPVHVAAFKIHSLSQIGQQAALTLTLHSSSIDVCFMVEARMYDPSTVTMLSVLFLA